MTSEALVNHDRRGEPTSRGFQSFRFHVSGGGAQAVEAGIIAELTLVVPRLFAVNKGLTETAIADRPLQILACALFPGAHR